MSKKDRLLTDDIKQAALDRIKMSKHYDIESMQNDLLYYKATLSSYKNTMDTLLTLFKKEGNHSAYYEVLYECVKNGLYLDKGMYCDCVKVRIAVAKQGYGLEVLVNDKSPNVRAEVAMQGYKLHELSKDPSQLVRKAAFRTYMKMMKEKNK